MNFEWALKAMRAGHKVQSSRTPAIWLDEEKEEFWYQTKRGVFNYTALTAREILAEDWDLDSVYEYNKNKKKGDNE